MGYVCGKSHPAQAGRNNGKSAEKSQKCIPFLYVPLPVFVMHGPTTNAVVCSTIEIRCYRVLPFATFCDCLFRVAQLLLPFAGL